MEIKFIVDDNAELPAYATEGSAGFDLIANSFKSIYTNENLEIGIPQDIDTLFLPPFNRLLVGTGLKVELPKGVELQIRPRSGNTLKKGLTVLNSPGTIDSDYRGEIGVILYNSSNRDIVINLGDKIAQGILANYIRGNLVKVDELEETSRGSGGFGSTDKISS